VLPLRCQGQPLLGEQTPPVALGCQGGPGPGQGLGTELSLVLVLGCLCPRRRSARGGGGHRPCEMLKVKSRRAPPGLAGRLPLPAGSAGALGGGFAGECRASDFEGSAFTC